jgi:signal transduction histidine kinase
MSQDKARDAALEGGTVEHERRRVAQQLHDGLAQDLAALDLRISLCQQAVRNDPDGVERDLAEIRQLLRRNLRAVRQLIASLQAAP